MPFSTEQQHDESSSDKIEQQDDTIRENPRRHVPPDGGYGWVCMVAVCLINAHSWGIISVIFLSYYLAHDVYPNTGPLVYAFTGGLSIACGLLVAPLVTFLIQVAGTRFVLNVGIFFETISLIGASFAVEQWHMILSQGVCFGIGMGFLFVGSVGIVPQWFHKYRGIAMGVSSVGTGLGGLIYSLAVGVMIPRLGLAWSFRILAIITFVVNGIAGNLLKDHNQAIGGHTAAFHLPFFRRPQFILFLGWAICSVITFVALLFTVSDYALSIGLSSHQASIVSAVLNLGQTVGRPCVGLCSDRYGRLNIAALSTFLCGLFCLVIWVFVNNMGVLCLFVLLAGANSCTYFATVSPVLAEIVGLKGLLSALSINWLFLVGPTLCAEPIALVLRNQGFGNGYLRVQLLTGFLYIGAAACLWIARAWKVCQVRHFGRNSEIGTVTEQKGLWDLAGITRGTVCVKRV
ncbi:hypothetical protein ASPWEDRAFT_104653 [Aspergillus wentii DTO 134E9]|uniref:Major facilitator superfamily (MFS) profile domain-containing protein n=1 Tax=Aspergillus wentii DTO 134E9 TaxID=1073089 RepID=A0A1L9RYC0_ASPWE|nr:uncharacterized protein ASPWEDRAFT_104653 [Aspergillus wentii DTO 134E9]OJJ39960.1 hypothetical protein ASPWEDRAFT_104653 [Aspergillus wentii DTO 134E9]